MNVEKYAALLKGAGKYNHESFCEMLPQPPPLSLNNDSNNNNNNDIEYNQFNTIYKEFIGDFEFNPSIDNDNDNALTLNLNIDNDNLNLNNLNSNVIMPINASHHLNIDTNMIGGDVDENESENDFVFQL